MQESKCVSHAYLGTNVVVALRSEPVRCSSVSTPLFLLVSSLLITFIVERSAQQRHIYTNIHLSDYFVNLSRYISHLTPPARALKLLHIAETMFNYSLFLIRMSSTSNNHIWSFLARRKLGTFEEMIQSFVS